MKNLNLKILDDTSPTRKMAMGTWKTVGDPSVYGLIEIDMSEVQKVLPDYELEHDIKVTPSHLVGKAIAHCMNLRPEINGMIRGSRIYLREDVTLFYQVNIPGIGHDAIKKATLSGTTIPNAEDLRVYQIAKALKEKTQAVRAGEDREIADNLKVFEYLPWCLSRLYLNIGSWLIYGLNLNMSFFGLPRDPFGSVMITNIGSLGIDLAWAPLCPYSRVPLLLTVGAVTDKPVAIEGKVEIRPMLPIAVTFDHRLIDGVHAAQMASELKKCFREPETYLL
ncbi:MAG: 2-oxo acid dehydrogenase subunit E2 [Bacteriovoracaceae bacterium]|nr:2-oxo acid dehydrogenase subunit E2 [Bacteriovoracaceae bacterium]